MDAEQIMSIIGTRTDGHWGIRGLQYDEDYRIGGSVRESYEWNREADHSCYPDGPTMGQVWRDGYKVGICTIGIDDPEDLRSIQYALRTARRYSDRFALLHAYDAEYGDDEGEVILFGDRFEPVEIVAEWSEPAFSR